MEATRVILLIVLALGVVQQVVSECRLPPLWMFSLPEDVEPIFSGLTCKYSTRQVASLGPARGVLKHCHDCVIADSSSKNFCHIN